MADVQQQLIHEYAFNGKERNGALTYWLLDSLQKLGNDVTYQALHARILAKVNTQFEQQTPMLQGEGARLIFSGQSMSSQSAVILCESRCGKKSGAVASRCCPRFA